MYFDPNLPPNMVSERTSTTNTDSVLRPFFVLPLHILSLESAPGRIFDLCAWNTGRILEIILSACIVLMPPIVTVKIIHLVGNDLLNVYNKSLMFGCKNMARSSRLNL